MNHNWHDGGVRRCKVCGGTGISLTTECSGQSLTDELRSFAARGEIDYVNGQWVKFVRLALQYGVVSRNRRNFRHPSSSPATSVSRSIILPSLWKV
jgi:hypothetical protein